MVEPRVCAHATGSRDIAQAPQRVSVFLAQDGGPGEPVIHAGVPQGQLGDLGGIASPELMQRVTRAADYRQWTKDFLGGE